MATEPRTRTDRRRARTRQKLIDATRALIAESGVAELRVAEITDRADVALGSFYNYFNSKEEVVEVIVAETVNAVTGGVDSLIEELDDPAEIAIVPYRRVIRLAADDPPLARLLINLTRADARLETMVLPQAHAALKLGIDQGRLDIPDVHVTLSITLGGALAMIRAILEGRIPPTAETAAAEAVLRSLGLPHDEAREIANRPLPEERRRS